MPRGLAEPRGSPVAGPCLASSVTPAREPRAGTCILRGPALGISHSPEEGKEEAPNSSRQVAMRWGFVMSGRERCKPDGKGLGGFEPQIRPGTHHPEPADGKGMQALPEHCLPQSRGPRRAGTARHREG